MGKEKPAACRLAGRCGGCAYQGVAYPKQLRRKQKYLEGLLGKFGEIEPILGMENPLHYRNKVHHAFTHDRSGNIISGPYEAGSPWVLPSDECRIEDKKSQEIIHTIRRLLKQFHIHTYDEDTGYGVLRHVLVRRGFASGEIMVVLVIGSRFLPAERAFVKALRQAHPEITTVLLNYNAEKTSMILGKREKVLYGPGYIYDTLCGKRFRISSGSFYQVNPPQTEKLYAAAVSFAQLTGRETVIDAYCGIGTISLAAAKRAGRVIGVEVNPGAVRDAVRNARENGITNVAFYGMDAGAFMRKMASEKQRADVVFLDPPRSGSTVKFLDALVRLKPARVIYISCEPKSLARDLRYLTGNGFTVRKIQPVDMFPFTAGIEVVTLLEKDGRKSDTKM